MSTRASTEKSPSGNSFATRISIAPENRTQLITLLNQHIADTFDLRTHTKFAHWNVKGPNFYQLHLLFDSLAEKLDDHVDDMAERVTALGGVANGTARQTAALSRTPEFPVGTFKDLEVVAALADRFASVGNAIRAAIDEADGLGDKDTADLFTEVSRELDKSLYFLESHVQK